MSDNAHLYKISINAKQLGLVGFSLKYTHMNLVCVQGGLKAIKAYKKLLMKRIKWDGMNATGEDGCGAYCRICWEGTVERADFKFWSDKSFACEVDAVDYLVKNGVGAYWDTAKSFSWDEYI
jgi:U4/U6 small nuclear ribonucleoprotein PRP3